MSAPANAIIAPEGMEFDIRAYLIADDGTEIDVRLGGLPFVVPFEGDRDPAKIITILAPSLLPDRTWRFMTRAEMAAYKRGEDDGDEEGRS